MIHLPNPKLLGLFRLFSWPLPTKLLDFLIEQRGLGIIVLPKDKQKAEDFLRAKVKLESLVVSENDKRSAFEVAQFRARERLIIFPYDRFVRRSGSSTLLHEIGHAVDFLLPTTGSTLSNSPRWKKALEEIGPLSKYVKDTDSFTGYPLEQFATAFAAYFEEQACLNETLYKINPNLKPERVGRTHTIDHLSDRLIQLFKEEITDLFPE